MRSRKQRIALGILLAAGISAAIAAAVWAGWRAQTGRSPVQADLTYIEPDDPVVPVIARANSRINSDDPKDYTAEASERGLRELDEAIAARPDDPRLHWWRSLTLERMKRTSLARAAREEAIRLARLFPAGDELIGEYYRGHAKACLHEGDRAAGAASFLALFDSTSDASDYTRGVIAVTYLPRDPKAPGPGALFPDRNRLEEFWGPLDRFFESHRRPADARALAEAEQKVRVGMDYREVARAVGFPSFTMNGICHWDHGVPIYETCWWYQINDQTIVHVVIADKHVKKVEKTTGPAPETKPHRHRERASFEYRLAGTSGVAISPDGELVATGALRAEVFLHEVRGGRERSTIRIPGLVEFHQDGSLGAIAFSPDGKMLAVGGSYDASARLLDVASGRVLAILESYPVPKNEGRMDCVQALAFAPDGKTLATAGYDSNLRLWDVATGRLRTSLRAHSYELTAVAYSPDGKTIASGDYGGNVRLWDVSANRPRARWPGYDKAVVSLAFSPDGKTLAVARDVVRLRDVTTGQWRVEIRDSLPTFGQILAFSPDGKTLIVAGVWDAATAWDTASGRMIGLLEGHERYPESVAWSQNGKTIATCSYDDTMKLWDAPAPPASPVIKSPPEPDGRQHMGPSVAAQAPIVYEEPDDPLRNAVARAWKQVNSYNPKDRTPEANARGVEELDQAIARWPGEPELHWYRSLMLEQLQQRGLARAAREAAIKAARGCVAGDELLRYYYTEHAEACARARDAAAAAATFLARLDLAPECGLYWKVVSWLGRSTRGDPNAPGPGPAFPERERMEALWGPLDRFFESYRGPKNMGELDLVAQKVRVGMDYREVVREVGFPRFDMSGTCHWDHGVPVCDACWWYQYEEPTPGAEPQLSMAVVHVVIVEKRVKKVEKTIGAAADHVRQRHRERASFEYKARGVAGVAISPDGELAAAGGRRGEVHLREVRSGRERSSLRLSGIEEHDDGRLNAIAFSPDGRSLAVAGTEDAAARVLEIASGRVVATLESAPGANPGTPRYVQSLAFAPDGRTLATGGPDCDLRLWDVATGRLRAMLRGHLYNLSAVVYSPDGKTIASGDDHGNVRIWDVARNAPHGRWVGYDEAVAALAFSPDGKTLAVARDEGVIRLRDTETGAWRIEIPHGLPAMGQALAFSPDGKTLVVAGWRDSLTVWDTASGQFKGLLEGHEEYPTSVAWSRDGKTIVTGGLDNTLKLWDAPVPPGSKAGQ